MYAELMNYTARNKTYTQILQQSVGVFKTGKHYSNITWFLQKKFQISVNSFMEMEIFKK